MGNTIPRLLWAALLCLSLGSCGYTHGVRLPDGAETVGVAVFDNSSLFPQVEGDVFACMSTQASRMIAGRVLAPNRADLVIRGNILDYRRLVGAYDEFGGLLGSGVHIRMEAWLIDSRLGERIGDVIEFNRSVRYILGVREGEMGAREAALTNLCQEIILDLFNQREYRRSSQPGERTDDEFDLESQGGEADDRLSGTPD